MSKIKFPQQISDLLKESEFFAPIRALADRVGQILSDNQMPFFPDYTDHGVNHIDSVLKSKIDLVPDEVWEQSKSESNPRLLTDVDAVIMIGATLLHDIAMHLRVHGFRELIAEGSRFKPVDWFNQDHEGHIADQPWHALWDKYEREARKFSARELTNIIGEKEAAIWKFDGLPNDDGTWTLNDRLIVGEFLRRHHARLAHEIALYGFPGLPQGSGEAEFPAMGTAGHELKLLADLIGLTARSHGTSLRVCQEYLKSVPQYPKSPRPMGAAVLYAMALLRIADYLQMDRKRAPAVLLQLRRPQSPISVQEWTKHLAVQHIGEADDPRAISVTVSPSVKLSTFLQLGDLLKGLQRELDHATAVLDEIYGVHSARGLDQLQLAIRRVHSNLQTNAFQQRLPYVPRETGFSADPNLLTLLVEPLYGKEPSVGIRELVQNATDAVRALDVWCKDRNVSVDTLNLPALGADVLVDFVQHENGSWMLRVTDRGIGMTSDTIQQYFLRAGASFRQSSAWVKDFVDNEGNARVLKAGRFGVGVFSYFLIGNSFRIWTRNVDDLTSGHYFEVSAHSQTIEIQRKPDLPVGTTVEIDLYDDALIFEKKGNTVAARISSRVFDWYCLNWPKVVMRQIDQSGVTILDQGINMDFHIDQRLSRWRPLRIDGWDSIYWSTEFFRQHFSRDIPFLCNGIRIGHVIAHDHIVFSRFDWPEEIQLLCPGISVFDSSAKLPLTIQRDSLLDNKLPFIDDLARDVIMSFIAHALVCGPRSQYESMVNARRHPLSLHLLMGSKHSESSVRKYLRPPGFYYGLNRWVCTESDFIPTDPWLWNQLKKPTCLVIGSILSSIIGYGSNEYDTFVQKLTTLESHVSGRTMWNLSSSAVDFQTSEVMKSADVFIIDLFEELVEHGVHDLGQLDSAYVAVAAAGDTSVRHKYQRLTEVCSPWSRQSCSETGFQYHEIFRDMPPSSIAVEYVRAMWDLPSSKLSKGVFFCAELKTKICDTPESMLAKIWSECLGATAIPFDPDARKELVNYGRKHAGLRGHIEMWEEMQRCGADCYSPH
ncbi:MAG: ATP-binding protein [Phycisphaeraceae bacterium]|nr:ATP-binding protein [Phycisphaerales bacterium]MCB9860660.1 ATP-binding protein [Phycisphaeraceae bacterium]